MNPQWITYPRFLFHRKLHSYENKKRSARIALRRIGRCRFRDPPQAENLLCRILSCLLFNLFFS